MKILSFLILITLICNHCFAQSRREIDTLKYELINAQQDTNRVLLYAELSSVYRSINSDTAIIYGEKGLELAKKINFLRGEAKALNELGFMLRILGDIPKSLEYQYKGLQIAEKNHYPIERASCLRGVGIVYMHELDDYPKAIYYFLKQLQEVNLNPKEPVFTKIALYLNLGIAYQRNKQLDSALFYQQKALNQSPKTAMEQVVLYYYGDLQFQLGNQPLAFECLRKSLFLIQNDKGNSREKAEACTIIAKLFKETNQTDSCIYYAKLGLNTALTIDYKRKVFECANLLAKIYEPNDIKQAYYYLNIAESLNDELFGSKKIQDLQKTITEEQEHQRKIEADNIAHQNQLKQYALLTGLVVFLFISFIFYRNNKKQKEANTLLLQQKEEIQSTLSQLKSTQTQLIQSEKLASLGELTAGIAHEIQNPLNFVNNFSELSVDLVKDLKDELKRPDKDETYIGELFDDLSQNQEKINHHGKRASSIVKGMLEHSRASTGVKELTDINKLADEYLTLSYHGLRAKDKDFNADFTTDFDENLPKIEVIPQDIGRVLLNLINNAFYAVNQRQQLGSSSKLEPSYTPSVSVTTQQVDNQIIIKVKDNGIGMSEATKAKVFQPFFTTKPTGQGTGLGLSLAYDIVTKGHGGSLEVESTEGIGSEFIITLPF